MAKTAQPTPLELNFPVFSLQNREMVHGWARALALYDEAKVVARQIDLLGLRGA